MDNHRRSIAGDWEMKGENDRFFLKLFVSGASPNSVRAIANLKNFCDQYISSGYDLEIVDVYQQPAKASSEQIIALPMLIKYFPLPVKRFFGDLSDTRKVLRGMGLNK